MDRVQIQPLKSPVSTDIILPGCIGYTIRALNIAAMTKGSVRIEHPLKSDDTHAMLAALRTLGIAVDEEEDTFVVHGDVSDVKDDEYHIDIGLSGRTARSILALLCVVPGTKTVTCAEPFKKRPIADLVEGLRQLGAIVTYLEKEGHLPIKISSHKLKPGTVKMQGALSSQYFSAIMMIAPLIGDVTIEVLGEQSSKPFIDMTIDIMTKFGVTVTNQKYRSYHIDGSAEYKNPKVYEVEPEATSASYFFAVAAITKSTIKVLHADSDSLQGDISFAGVLETMGCKVRRNTDEKWVEITGTDTLKGVTVDMNGTPDLVPTLVVVAAFAKGKTTITGIAHARLKETDRIKSPAQELGKMGIRAESTHDSLTIYGGQPNSAMIETYHDHRMAMAFAVAGTRLSGMTIKDPDVVNKSFPEFWDVLRALTIIESNLVLTGMRGSGKSTIGHLLAKRLGRRFISMDKILEQQTGTTIPKMIARHGWDYFRDQESQLAHDMADERRAVIATGGGVILRPGNIQKLKQHGLFIFLDASIDNLEARIKDETDGRPALTNAKSLRQELEMVIKERREIYEETADIRVFTDNRTPSQVVDEIIQKIQGASK